MIRSEAYILTRIYTSSCKQAQEQRVYLPGQIVYRNVLFFETPGDRPEEGKINVLYVTRVPFTQAIYNVVDGAYEAFESGEPTGDPSGVSATFVDTILDLPTAGEIGVIYITKTPFQIFIYDQATWKTQPILMYFDDLLDTPDNKVPGKFLRCGEDEDIEYADLHNIQTLTDAAEITWNVSKHNWAWVELTADRILANPSAFTRACELTLFVKGSSQLTFGSKFHFPGGVLPVLSASANSIDMLEFKLTPTGDTYLVNVLSDLKTPEL